MEAMKLMTYEIIPAAGAGVFLVICCISDVRNKRISAVLLIAAGVVSAALNIYQVMTGRLELYEVMLCVVPGILLIITAFLTGEKIGYGDGAGIMILGLLQGTMTILIVLLAAMLMSSIYGAVLLIAKKAGKETAIPFYPFLLTAFLLTKLFEMLQ